MKKILILGAGIYQVPLIKRAKAMGLYTIVASIPGNYPGFEIADKVYYENTTDFEAILRVAKEEKIDGIVTAGSSSGRNDGAAAVLLMSAEKAEELGYKPLVKIRAIAEAGVDPRIMGMGPVPATAKALRLAGLKLEDMGLIELNEAFAAQSLGCIKEMGLEDKMDIINVNGGAVALGHPIGCSGVRILVTLIHEMKKRGTKYGLATLCVAGGMGMATIVENCD